MSKQPNGAKEGRERSFWDGKYDGEDVAILQMDKMVETALPEDLDSMESGNYCNIELPYRVEQKNSWRALEE